LNMWIDRECFKVVPWSRVSDYTWTDGTRSSIIDFVIVSNYGFSAPLLCGKIAREGSDHSSIVCGLNVCRKGGKWSKRKDARIRKETYRKFKVQEKVKIQVSTNWEVLRECMQEEGDIDEVEEVFENTVNKEVGTVTKVKRGCRSVCKRNGLKYISSKLRRMIKRRHKLFIENSAEYNVVAKIVKKVILDEKKSM